MSSFCLCISSENSFLMSCLKVFTFLHFISAGRLFHVFGPRKEMGFWPRQPSVEEVGPV